jgi:high affinity sulfate transporter 1
MPAWLFGSLRGYRSQWARGDLVAGLTVWAVLVPEALAYASIAGVSPVVGLYAGPGALVFYAVFGSSKHLIVGPMSATAALSAAAVGTYVAPNSGAFVTLTAALAISTGVVAMVAGLLRLGFLANFISEPVLKGFIVGLALTIMVGQLPELFGIEKGSGDFFQKLWHVITNLGDTHVLTLVIGLASLAIVLGLKRFAPAVPASLVAVAFGVIMVTIFDLNQHGVAIVGHIPRGLPPLGVPNAPVSDYVKLLSSGVGIMLVGFAEGLGAAKTYAAREGYEIDANRELLGLGAANAAAGLSSGMVVNGSLSKTAVNGSAGAHSQLSGLFVAVMTIITLLLLTGLFEKLPEATLAAVVIAAVIELVDIPALRRLYGIYTRRLGRDYGVAARPDFIAAVAAMLGVMVFDTLPGLFIGIACSVLLLIYRASRPRIATLGKVAGTASHYSDVDRHPEDASPDGVTVLRVEAGLFFANADWVRARVRQAAEQDGIHAVVLDAENISFIDVSAVEMLDQLDQDLTRTGVQFLIARDTGQVRDVVRHASEDERLRRVYPSVQAAVDAAQEGPRL